MPVQHYLIPWNLTIVGRRVAKGVHATGDKQLQDALDVARGVKRLTTEEAAGLRVDRAHVGVGSAPTVVLPSHARRTAEAAVAAQPARPAQPAQPAGHGDVTEDDLRSWSATELREFLVAAEVPAPKKGGRADLLRLAQDVVSGRMQPVKREVAEAEPEPGTLGDGTSSATAI